MKCKNCGTDFNGNFCNYCGEKNYVDKDKSIKHIFEEGFHFITHFEGKFLTTLKTVFTYPGKFSFEYCNGLRKKYFKPVSLFFLIVILYLLFPRFKGLNMSLETYLSKNYDFTWVSIPIIKAKKEAKKIELKEVIKLYNTRSPAVSKITLFILLPLGSLLLFLLFLNNKRYFFDHFILSIELSSLYIALHFLVIPFISFIAELINKDWMEFFMDSNYWLNILLVCVDLLIVTVAFKRFYQQKWLWTILKSIVYLSIYNIFIFYLYRLIVLLITTAFI